MLNVDFSIVHEVDNSTKILEVDVFQYDDWMLTGMGNKQLLQEINED